MQVYGEIEGGLESWKEDGRWEGLGLKEQFAENPHLRFAY